MYRRSTSTSVYCPLGSSDQVQSIPSSSLGCLAGMLILRRIILFHCIHFVSVVWLEMHAPIDGQNFFVRSARTFTTCHAQKMNGFQWRGWAGPLTAWAYLQTTLKAFVYKWFLHNKMYLFCSSDLLSAWVEYNAQLQTKETSLWYWKKLMPGFCLTNSRTRK